VTLQRPPPEIRTFDRTFGDFSISVTVADGLASAAAIAPKNPAAPPPTTTKRSDFDLPARAESQFVIAIFYRRVFGE
jgi:hypothetical protein